MNAGRPTAAGAARENGHPQPDTVPGRGTGPGSGRRGAGVAGRPSGAGAATRCGSAVNRLAGTEQTTVATVNRGITAEPPGPRNRGVSSAAVNRRPGEPVPTAS